MKIVQLIANTEYGGATQIAYLLADGLRARGHEVETCFLYAKGATAQEMKAGRTLFGRPPKALGSLKIAVELWSMFKAMKPDAVITHTPKTGILGHFLARMVGVRKRIAVQHNPLWVYSRLTRRLDRLSGSTGFYTCNVAVSRSVLQSVSHYSASYNNKLHVIYNGIPRKEQPTDSRDEVLIKWNLPKGCFLLVNVGRLSHQKNQSAILKAMSGLPEARLIIVGDGELHDSLAAEARMLNVSDRVCFTGEISSGEVPSILHASDVFVFPSRFEGMPLSLMEAMQAGKPVVASNIPPNVELLGDDALFVEPEDAAGLEDKVRMLLEDGDLRRSLAEKTRARADLFSLERMVDNYERLVAAL